MATLHSAFETARKTNAGFRPARLVMNPTDALNFFEALPEKYVDKNVYAVASAEFGAINEMGATFIGRIAVPGMGIIDVISYSGAYRSNKKHGHQLYSAGQGNPCTAGNRSNRYRPRHQR